MIPARHTRSRLQLDEEKHVVRDQTFEGKDFHGEEVVFREVMQAGKVKPLKLSARSPNLNAFAERWVRSVKEECLSRLIFFGEHSLRRAVTEYIDHFHRERNHQGKGNKLLFPAPRGPVQRCCRGTVQCKERLGGLCDTTRLE